MTLPSGNLPDEERREKGLPFFPPFCYTITVYNFFRPPGRPGHRAQGALCKNGEVCFFWIS